MSLTTEDLIEHAARESGRFLDVLRPVLSPTRVPSCPDWDVDDLLFHLAEVQNFWAIIVGERLVGSAQVDLVRSVRPRERAEMETLVAQNTTALVRALRSGPPETEVWTWSPDHSLGFVARRQAHEVLIHRVDAELAANDRTPLNPTLAADGVQEVLGVMYGDPPGWGAFVAAPERVVRFSATDTGDVWTVTVGRFVGTHPEGRDVDVPCLGWLDDDQQPTAEVVGSAGDLDCWLWRREPLAEVTTTGDEATLAALAESMAAGIQ